MKRFLIQFLIILIPGLIVGCGYFQKKDEPPPLPPIEETKPPLTMKSEYFKSFPWTALSKPRKDGNEPDTSAYTIREGDTLDKVAESTMGDQSLAVGLAEYNDLSSPSKISQGEKIVIPNPIIGMSSQMLVKAKREKDFTPAKGFDVEMKTGDEYKMKFESNVDGYAYIFRQGPKGMDMLYPARPPQAKKQVKKGKKPKRPEPVLAPDAGKVKAHEPFEIPIGKKGFAYDPKKAGDQVLVFLSLRPIPELEDLKEREKKIRPEEVEDVKHRVKGGEVFSQPPYHLLRISDPNEILWFELNLTG